MIINRRLGSIIELKKNEDLKVMWSTYQRYESNDSIEMDMTVTRHVNDIIMLRHSKSSSTI